MVVKFLSATSALGARSCGACDGAAIGAAAPLSVKERSPGGGARRRRLPVFVYVGACTASPSPSGVVPHVRALFIQGTCVGSGAALVFFQCCCRRVDQVFSVVTACPSLRPGRPPEHRLAAPQPAPGMYVRAPMSGVVMIRAPAARRGAARRARCISGPLCPSPRVAPLRPPRRR